MKRIYGRCRHDGIGLNCLMNCQAGEGMVKRKNEFEAITLCKYCLHAMAAHELCGIVLANGSFVKTLPLVDENDIVVSLCFMNVCYE
jgi:hypothetical protein